MTERRSRRKQILEGLLRAIDVTVGLVAIVAGIFALAATPPTILREVTLPGLIAYWGLMLLVGGVLMSVGRLLGYWLPQTGGIVLMAGGTAIYAIVIGQVIHNEVGVVVAFTIIVIAGLLMLRRYIELQTFTWEPTDRGVMAGIMSILSRRTDNGGRPAASA